MEKCECGYEISTAPGIGDYCTNKKCPVEAARYKDWQENHKRDRLQEIMDYCIKHYNGNLQAMFNDLKNLQN